MTYDIPSLLDGYDADITPQTAPDMAKLRETVARKLEGERASARKPKHTGRTLLIAAAAAALLCVGALAAALGGFDWLRDEVEPEFIDAVEPVERSVTDNGIRFAVIAAGRYEDGAVIYFSVSDTLGEGRITEAAEVIPELRAAGSYNLTAGLVYYDPESQTAVFETFLSSYAEPDDGEVTFAIREILSGGEGINSPLDDLAFEPLRGDWSLELDLGRTLGMFETVTDVRAGDTVFENVSVMLTPLGLSLKGDAGLEQVKETFLMPLKAALITEQGEIVLGAADGSAPVLPVDMNEYYEGKDVLSYYANWRASSAVDVDAVTAIRIGDTRIELK